MRKANIIIRGAIGLLSLVSITTQSYAVSKAVPVSSSQLSKDKDGVRPPINFIIPEANYNYYDFKFDSTSGSNFNRYQGHSNLYGLAGNIISIAQKMALGVSISQVDSTVDSQFFLAPSPLFLSRQDIKTNTLALRLLRQMGFFTVDLSGGFGRVHVNNSITFPSLVPTVTGYGTSDNNLWFTSLTGLYFRDFAKYYYSGNIQVLYTNVGSGDYQLFYGPFGDSFNINKNTTQATWIMENAEAGYHLNDMITPFVSGGLIQVADFRNSNLLITAPIIGAIPQLNNDKNGFRVGGGITLTKKPFTLRLEQQYYQTGSVYSSNQTMLKLTYLPG